MVYGKKVGRFKRRRAETCTNSQRFCAFNDMQKFTRLVLTYFWLRWVLLYIWLSFTIHYFLYIFQVLQHIAFRRMPASMLGFLVRFPSRDPTAQQWESKIGVDTIVAR